jgi:formyl-CoA transferase
MIAQATSGAMSVTGFADRPPVVTGVNVGDAGTGMHLTIAILAALVQRQQTGRGQLVEVAMQEAVLNITRVKFTPTLTNGRPLERMGNRSASGAYADLVRCAGAGPDDYVYLMLPPDSAEPFEALVDIIGRHDLRADDRFATPPARARHTEELTAIIEGWTMKRDKHEVMRRLAGRGIPCGAVLDTAEVLRDPHLRERGMVFDLEHPTRGRFAMIGSPLRMSDSPVDATRAPLFGEHTEEVLITLGGYTPEDVRHLREKGAI